MLGIRHALAFALCLALVAASAGAQERVCRGDRTRAEAAVAAADPHAVDAAHAVLAEGGNAMDAAVAANLALGVVEPSETGIGGGGFLLYRDGASGAMTLYDGRETAPAAAAPDRFLLAGGWKMPFPLAVVSGRAVGVPGLVAMLHTAQAEHGALAWPKVVAPAIRLAEDGAPVPKRLAELVERDPSLDLFAGTRRLFAPIEDGAARWRNPRLAASLRAIAADGPSALYEGAIAEAVAAAVNGRWLWPGKMTREDLAGYEIKRRRPVCASYREWRVCGAPPPSSGGIALLQILGLLERFDMAALAPGSVEGVHLIAEASRLAYGDRARHIGDPAFAEVPVEGLISQRYLAARSALISPRRAMRAGRPGDPPAILARAGARGRGGGGDTSHLSVLDCAGNAVALTSSIEAPFGSRNAVRGFLLNNQLTDFAFRPETDSRPRANRVQPGKRPMSAMAPTIVFGPEGRVRLVLGARGGPRIIGHVAKTVIGVLDWELSLQEAIARPNFVHTGAGVLELEAGTRLAEKRAALEAMGHTVETVELTSGLHGIERRGRRLIGAADPRMHGAAR